MSTGFSPRRRRIRLTPPQIVLVSFAAAILAGSGLLMLPWMTYEPGAFRYIDALFTSTSAICVTGLITVDTATVYTPIGKAVIAVLIQVGGLGIVTAATILVILTGRRISLSGRMAVQETLGHLHLSGVVRLVVAIILVSLAFETTGAVVMGLDFWLNHGYGAAQAAGHGLFHSISAFNNAGFALYTTNLEAFRADWAVNLTVASLVVFGGLGFPVILELGRLRRSRLSLHTKLVLSVTAGLLVTATAGFMIFEWGAQSLSGLTTPEKVLASVFQAVTPRTAGFNTVPMGTLLSPTVFMIIFLMFIGASPESTGGGIKTTTFGVILSSIWATARGKSDVEVFSRRIGQGQVLKALTVLSFASALVAVMSVLLLLDDPGIDVTDGVFEVVSAFGTVGLSLGVTPGLSTLGKIIILITMYAGRVGPVTLGVALWARQRRSPLVLPEEQVPLG